MRTDGQAELNNFGNYSGKGKKERKGFSHSTVTGFLISPVLLRDGPELTSSSTTTKSLRGP